MKKVTRKIEVELTKEEIAQLGENAARMQRELFEKELDFADYKKNTKRQIDTSKQVIAETLKSIDRGVKEVNVDCYEEPNLFEKEFNYLLDGEIVDKRAMTFDEFDSLVESLCEKKINDLTYDYEYYYENKIVISRPMTAEQIEEYKEEQKGQVSLPLEK